MLGDPKNVLPFDKESSNSLLFKYLDSKFLFTDVLLLTHSLTVSTLYFSYSNPSKNVDTYPPKT